MNKKNLNIILESGVGYFDGYWGRLPELLENISNSVLIHDRRSIQRSKFKDLTISHMNSSTKLIVAHSLGSVFSQIYISKHPKNIVGLVLIDPIPYSLFDIFHNVDKKNYNSWKKIIYSKEVNPEGWNILDLKESLKLIEKKTHNNLNLLLISSHDLIDVPSEWSLWWPYNKYRSIYELTRNRLKKQYILSSELVLNNTDHYPFRSHPEIISNKISEFHKNIQQR